MHLLLHFRKYRGDPLIIQTFILILFCVINFVNSSSPPSASSSPKPRPPPTTYVKKCCRIGEYLDKSTNECLAGGTEKWIPTVFLTQRNVAFFPKGDAPKFFRIIEQTFPTTCNHPQYFRDHSNLNIVIFANGSLYIHEINRVITPENFCVDKDSAMVCFPENPDMDSLVSPRKLIKIKKCCGHNTVYHQPNVSCVVDERSHQLFHSNLNSKNVDVIYGFPDCNVHDYAIAGDFTSEKLNEETGTILLDSGKSFGAEQYCLEHTLSGIDKNVNVITCSEHFNLTDGVVIQKHDVRFKLYSIGLLISVVFLFATLVASFLVPSNHHVLHWRCQTHYVACLLVGDLILAISQISGVTAGLGCTVMAIFMHFFFLAAFFWLNTMCFNIWWTFRDFRPTSLEKGQELCRLRIYEVYAWGVPLLISGVAAILDNLPETPGDTFLRPRFGQNRCWFFGDMEILTYFYGPIGFLLFINLLLFASTARQLTCGLWKRDDVKSTTERAALGRVCMKLVVVMGVTWVADVLSWVVGGPQYIWYLTDLINALQGVFIFVVVGCQPQVWSAVKKLWSTKTGRGVTNTTNGVQHSSSSHGLPSMGESVTNNTFTNTTSTKIPMETIC